MLSDWPLFGRLQDLEVLRARAPVRALTLYGPPGVGKSAVARELARRLVDVYPGGITFAEAASLDSLGTPAGRRLVVFDDADALVPLLRRRVPRWLEETPLLDVIVVSREVLGVREEMPFEVRPLSPADGERLAKAALGPVCDADATVKLADASGGLPLAIVGARSPSGAIDVANGREALRAAFARSFDSLDEPARQLLALSSLFSGTFSIELLMRVAGRLRASRATAHASESLGDAPHPALHESRIADGLQTLVERSLVQVAKSPTPERRFSVLAPFRAFALEAIGADAPFVAAAVDARNRTLGEFAGTFDHLWGFSTPRERSRAEIELANLRDVVRSGEPDDAARAALVLDALEGLTGSLSERAVLLDAAAARSEATDKLLRMTLDVARARVRVALYDTDMAAAILEPILDDTTDVTPAIHAAAALMQARVCIQSSEFDAARSWLERAIVAAASDARSRGRTISFALLHLAYLDAPDAKIVERLRAAIYELRRAGDAFGEARASAYLGALLLDVGDADEARAVLEDARDMHRALEDRSGEFVARSYLARAFHLLGRFDDGRREFERTAEAARTRGDTRAEAVSAGHRALLELEVGDLDASRKLAAAAMTLAKRCDDRALAAFFTGVSRMVRAIDGPSGDPADEDEDADWLWEPTSDAERLIIQTMAEAAAVMPFESAQAQEDFVRAIRARHPRLAVLEQANADAKILFRVLSSALCRTRSAGATRLVRPRLALSSDGAVTRVDDHPVDLASRPLLRRLLLRLASSGRSNSVGELVQAGWPDERILTHAASQRVHSAVRRLRDAGLAHVIRSDREGYWIDAEVEWVA
jgi:tetratricopeptide (TPR) repeat protein